MIRLASLFWLILVAATGAAMFFVKYQVQDLEEQIAQTGKATAAEQHEIRMLTAEWAYLNRPEALDAMNRRFLSLVPVQTKQLRTGFDDIPMRPAPAPDVEVAAAAAPAAPAVTGTAAMAPPPVVPASLPAAAAPAVVKAVAHPGPLRPAKSIDDLFSRITGGR